MRAFITGINGFVGRHLVIALQDRGWKTFGLSLEPSPSTMIRRGDLLDLPLLTSIVQDIMPDAVFHLAGTSSVKQSWDQPELAMRVNRDGTDNLYKALSAISPPVTVLLASSAEVYGIPTQIPMTETHAPNPINPYGRSKYAAEEVSRKYPSIHTIITRSFPHIGPGQRSGFVIPDVAQQIVEIERGKRSELLIGNTEARRDLTDVRDTVNAYILLVTYGKPGEIYNVCSNTAYKIADVVARMISMSSTPIKVCQDPTLMRPSDIPILRGDPAKVWTATGWKPKIPFGKTLRAILQYFRSQP